MKTLASAIETIGNTPLVDLSRLSHKHGVTGRILAKLEYLNPGASKKDRFAKQIIEDLEASGKLKPGQTIVELTSGNTGTGLAIVCAIKGYPFIAVMSRGNSVERARMISALGGEVVLVDQAPGSLPGQVSGIDLDLVEAETQRIVKERGAIRADQFNALSNLRAHEQHTAPEAWQQSGGNIDMFADFAGTGGTFAGCARYFKKQNPNIRCYIVEPESAPYLAGGKVTNPNHKIQGGAYCRDLPLLDSSLVDGYLTVSNDEAIQFSRDLARFEGIFGGFSSGANVAAAVKLLKQHGKEATVLSIICDSGLKYVSTDLYPAAKNS
jgi:cysteine synthase